MSTVDITGYARPSELPALTSMVDAWPWPGKRSPARRERPSVIANGGQARSVRGAVVRGQLLRWLTARGRPSSLVVALLVSGVMGLGGWVSFADQRSAILAFGLSGTVAWAIPIMVDGLLTLSQVQMILDKTKGYIPRLWAKIGLAFGITFTLAFNMLSVVAHDPAWQEMLAPWMPALRMVVMGCPAAALLITSKMLMAGKLKRAPGATSVAKPAQKPPTPRKPSAAAAPRASRSKRSAATTAAS